MGNMRHAALVRFMNNHVPYLPGDVPGLQNKIVMLCNEIYERQHAGQQMAVL